MLEAETHNISETVSTLMCVQRRIDLSPEVIDPERRGAQIRGSHTERIQH